MNKLFSVMIVALIAMLIIAPVTAQETTIVFWTSEVQPERIERQQAIADAFMAENEGVVVEIVPTEESEQVNLMTAALAAGDLPDVVLHSVQFSARWVQDGALDAAAATSIIEELGMDTFSEGALDLAQLEDGSYASVPSDGWGQLLLFRKDLFDSAGLAAPDSYENILAAAEALHSPDDGMIGFCGPNATDQQYTWQVFEHVALANGATFVDADGNITFDSPEMVEAIAFYDELMTNYGPGEAGWYWDQTRANYLAGNCAMTIWSPFILDEMAGLRDGAYPTCAECEENPAFIAENTSVVSAFTGYSNDVPAAWGSTYNAGISPTAPDAARDFILFWFNEAYLDALSIAPEGKFPMRRGTPDNPTEFIDGWAMLDVGVDRRAPLSDFYDEDTLNIIVAGSDGYTRMGFDVGQSVLASA
ncbi:MAG: extracellular solute-binding protein, partial [Anaerolineae bacterium]|nr:extracellular solute-binding protein [Anaerolineae bacterium]